MPEIITCPQWDARKPKAGLTLTSGPASRIIIHHTAGHHPEVGGAGESRDEAIAYAHAIQNFHMDTRGWLDSGHNFLVCRNGVILQGRWLTVSAIEAGHMVVSAHCPGQNDQVGIEHEHVSGEQMTDLQRNSSAWLIAWVSGHCGRRRPLPLFPHSEFFPTACPDVLAGEIPALTTMAADWMGL